MAPQEVLISHVLASAVGTLESLLMFHGGANPPSSFVFIRRWKIQQGRLAFLQGG